MPGAAPADFSSTTVPSLTEVTFHIQMRAADIDMAFSEAGYKVPFAVWSTETWPSHQTSFLQFLNVLGAAANVLMALKPAPAMPTQREYDQDNVYAKKFNELVDRIKAGKVRFRADAYAGTPAYKSLYIPRAPMTDFGEGIIDGADYLELRDYTLLRQAVGDVWQGWGGATDLTSYDWDTLRAWGKR